MKAITIQQPWASLIAFGDKKFETRTWRTNYRGPIAIHAAKQIDPDVFQFLLCKLSTMDELEKCGITPKRLKELPTGAVIATAELVDVWIMGMGPSSPYARDSIFQARRLPYSDDFFVPTEKERAFGNWIPGNYAWQLENVKILPKPIPAKGQQGLWNWEPEREGAKTT